MRAGIAALIVCCTLTLASACGSSSTSAGDSGASPSAAAGAPAAAGTSSTATTGTGAAGTSAASTAGGETLRVDRTPKFAAPSPSAPVQSGLVQIAYRDITIQPDTVRVKLGSTVRWTNYDSVKANVTSVAGPQRIASKDFGEGGTFEVKLEKPGVIHYVCTLYPVTMNGTIEVVS